MAGIVRSTLIVGMEIHVELSTRSKMFCRAPSPAHAEMEDAEPNSLLDPVVLGLPGALPVLNRSAIELSMRVGLALGCSIAERTKWDRKGYFYPDLPKGYQISQYDLPLCFDGAVDVPDPDSDGSETLCRVGIIRAHLEEDAGKLLHEWPGGKAIDYSIIDLNRAGTALLEIVTAPDMRSAEEAVAFAQMLHATCCALGVTEGVMQRGHMRFEPNINMELEFEGGRTVRTPIVEIKNLNSFRAVRGAIEYEQAQQPKRFLEDGREMGPGAKSTRGWDDARAATVLQREKEDAHDYRYFPDPDLAPLDIDREWVERVRETLPELPHARARRYQDDLGLGVKDARGLASEVASADLFDASFEIAARSAGAIELEQCAKALANLVLQQGNKLANERSCTVGELGISPDQLAGLVALRLAGDIGSSAVDQVFAALTESDDDARSIAERLGLLQVSDDGALTEWCRQVIADPANTKAVEDVRSGKQQAIGRLVGGAMKLSGGRADAKRVREMLLELIGS